MGFDGPGPNGRGFQPFLAARFQVIAKLLILIAAAWQKGPSRLLPPSCRFRPSCSAYAITALQRYGAVRGSWLAAQRLLRCHPWGGAGDDPVP